MSARPAEGSGWSTLLPLAALLIVPAGFVGRSLQIARTPPSGGGSFLPAERMTLSGLELGDARGKIVWRIEADHPVRLGGLAYGIVPSGFAQVVPPGAATPRDLAPGETLTLEISAPGAILETVCDARGPRGLACTSGMTVAKAPGR
jgi:hypothetical protein